VTTVDVPTTDILVSQTTLILTLIITLGSASAIIYQAVRGINKRIKKAREEADSKIDAKIEQLRKEVVDLKERSDYLNHRIIDGFFNQKRESTE
jgi:cell division protein FtsB